MMKNYIKFKSASNADHGVYLTAPLVFPSPAERGEEVPVPGRDGAVWLSDGAYDEVQGVATVWIPRWKMSALPDIRAWLTGSGRLEIGRDADRYYNARVSVPLALTPVDFWDGYDGMLTFAAEPFPYLAPGPDIEITVSGTEITNPGRVYSMPKLVVAGSGDVTVTVGAYTFELAGLSTATIDCETQECTVAGAPANNIMTGPFPVLVPGDNAVGWTGTITKITITPRWRDL